MTSTLLLESRISAATSANTNPMANEIRDSGMVPLIAP